MEAPPKLQYFEVAVLISKIHTMWEPAKEMNPSNPVSLCFRSSLMATFPEHRKYLIEVDRSISKNVDAMIALVIEEEWIESVKQALHHDEDTSH